MVLFKFFPKPKADGVETENNSQGYQHVDNSVNNSDEKSPFYKKPQFVLGILFMSILAGFGLHELWIDHETEEEAQRSLSNSKEPSEASTEKETH